MEKLTDDIEPSNRTRNWVTASVLMMMIAGSQLFIDTILPDSQDVATAHNNSITAQQIR